MVVKKRKIAFINGTRGDFGKIKSLIEIERIQADFELHVFVT